jgi:hypothetical protein
MASTRGKRPGVQQRKRPPGMSGETYNLENRIVESLNKANRIAERNPELGRAHTPATSGQRYRSARGYDQRVLAGLHSAIGAAEQARFQSTSKVGAARTASTLTRANRRLNPATRGALAGAAVGGSALAAVAIREKYKNKARTRSAKAMAKGHAGKAGGSPSKTQGKGNRKGGAKGRKGAPLRGAHGQFAGWSS